MKLRVLPSVILFMAMVGLIAPSLASAAAAGNTAKSSGSSSSAGSSSSTAAQSGPPANCILEALPIGCLVMCEDEGVLDDGISVLNAYGCLGSCGFTKFFCGYDHNHSGQGNFEDCIKLWCNTVLTVPSD